MRFQGFFFFFSRFTSRFQFQVFSRLNKKINENQRQTLFGTMTEENDVFHSTGRSCSSDEAARRGARHQGSTWQISLQRDTKTETQLRALPPPALRSLSSVCAKTLSSVSCWRTDGRTDDSLNTLPPPRSISCLGSSGRSPDYLNTNPTLNG